MKQLLFLFSPPRPHAPTPFHSSWKLPFLFCAVLLIAASPRTMAQCFAGCETTLSSSNIPTTPVRPFCNSNGFTVTAAVNYDDGCNSTGADVFVIVETSIKLDGSRFRDDIIANVRRYYSDLQYAPGVGSPTLTSTDTLSDFQRSAIIFRFRVTLPPPSPALTDTLIVTLPFTFAPNFFFGDTPWRVWVSAREPDLNGLPKFPPMPPFNNFQGALVGTLRFDAPYFPMVGSQNVSTHYADLTGFWADPNVNRTHSIMVLPNASGAAPVLTVDVPLLILGFFSTGGPNPVVGLDRGNLLMWPGAQVKVINPDTLAMGYVDMFTCKEQVSKGILVEQGARLDQSNSTFTDAELAINLKKGSKFTSFGGITLFNNYKGMRIDNSGGASVPAIVAEFGQTNTFTTTATLKLPYTGMTQPTSTKGYGLEIIDHPGINLFNGSFSGLNNGVRLVRSSFTTRASFAGINADAGSTVPYQGWAIWGLGTGTQMVHYFNGGIIPFFPFGNSDKGIYLNNMNATVDRVDIVANEGIHLVNCKSKLIRITGNPSDPNNKFLSCKYYGIKTSNCLPLNLGSIIRDYKISMSNTGNTGPTGTGILLGEGSNVTTPNSVGWILQNNRIYLNGTHWGIRGLGVYRSEFRSNEVRVLTNTNLDVIGIDVLNTRNLLANCNKVYADLSESTARGYLFTNVNQSDYTCNEANKLRRGMEYAVLCEGTTLKGSEIKNTSTGLLLRNNVVLGTQGLDAMTPVQDHGNRWVVSSASHEATQQSQVDLSKFGVDPPENAEFNPPNNWGQGWFKPEVTPTIPTFYCAGFPCLSPQEPPVKDRSVEKAVANGSIYTVGLPGVMPKMLENHLYAELQQNPAWATDPIYAQFVQSKYGSTTAAYWQIRQGIDALNNRTSTEQSSVAAAETAVSNLRHDLFLLDSTYASGTAISQAQYSQKLADLSSATLVLQSQLDNIRSAHLTQATQLLTQNAANGTTQAWELGEKQVNNLEIRIFMQDSVTTAQLTLLDALGSLCPNDNGEAVLRARVLYNRFVEKEFTPTCANAGGGSEERENGNSAPATLLLSPNPTSGIVTIPNVRGQVRKIQVFDITGRVIYQLSTAEVEIDLSKLNNGVYLLRIRDENTGRMDSAKLIISK